MKKLRGFTLIELLIVVAIIAILAAIAVPNFLEAQTRSKVSRVRSDHRSLATAIETYYIDTNEYPACTTDPDLSFDSQFYDTAPSEVGATFMAKTNTGGTETLNTITTPIAYISSIFPDPFADTKGKGFLYYSDGRGWILGSWGPDVDEIDGGDLLWDEVDACGEPGGGTKQDEVYYTDGADGVETVYKSTVAQPSILLLTGGSSEGSYTYDPTNGTISPGDVWRVKQ